MTLNVQILLLAWTSDSVDGQRVQHCPHTSDLAHLTWLWEVGGLSFFSCLKLGALILTTSPTLLLILISPILNTPPNSWYWLTFPTEVTVLCGPQQCHELLCMGQMNRNMILHHFVEVLCVPALVALDWVSFPDSTLCQLQSGWELLLLNNPGCWDLMFSVNTLVTKCSGFLPEKKKFNPPNLFFHI